MHWSCHSEHLLHFPKILCFLLFLLFFLTESFALIISTNLSVKFPLSSSNPFWFPAKENAWQGVPPHNKSGASIFLTLTYQEYYSYLLNLELLGIFPLKLVMEKGAISENHLKDTPIGFQATDAASIPEHILPTVFIIAPPPHYSCDKMFIKFFLPICKIVPRTTDTAILIWFICPLPIFISFEYHFIPKNLLWYSH